MATPSYLTGFEIGVNPTTNGLGLWDAVNGSPVVDTSIKRTGNYSLKIVAPGGGTAYFCRKNYGTQQKINVGTIHFYIPTGGLPSANTVIAGFTFTTATVAAGLRITTAGLAGVQVGGGAVGGAASFSLDAWHRVDMKIDVTGTTWTLDWYLDGVSQTQGTLTGQATTDSVRAFRFGSSSTTASYTAYFDDCMFTETSGDYPLGNLAIEGLLPDSDGTHNAGTNTMEAQDGTDIGVTPAYNKINSNPPSSTSYIRQFTIGTGNYAEVNFANFASGFSAIHGARVVLAYTSESTPSNSGGCIVSKDGFATKTVVWGESGALQDYSDGSTANLYYKTAIIAGVTDLTTVNALQARMGYAGDVTPNPYWIDMIVEVAYVPSTDIDLDLVSYTFTFPDITLLESVIESLDLVSYSFTFPDITVTENVAEVLDLVSYSFTFPDITVLESVVESLDLVSYSFTFPDITVLESVVEVLDLVSYTFTFPDVTILENVVEALDLVSYSFTFPDITVLENVVESLDLVSYSFYFPDVTILDNVLEYLDLVEYSSSFPDLIMVENVVDDLDLVSYSSSFFDLETVENVVEQLDLVSYSSDFNDVDLLEAGDLPLDLVEYSSVFNDLSVLENEIILLDLVTYSSQANDLEVVENVVTLLDPVTYISVFYDVQLEESSDFLLDLVSYSSTFYDITFDASIPAVVPVERTYAINARSPMVAVDKQIRMVSVDHQDRTIY